MKSTKRARQKFAVITASLTIMARGEHLLTGNRPAYVRNLFKRGEALGAGVVQGGPGGSVGS